MTALLAPLQLSRALRPKMTSAGHTLLDEITFENSTPPLTSAVRWLTIDKTGAGLDLSVITRPSHSGVTISSIGPSCNVGLRVGDHIVTLNDVSVTDQAEAMQTIKLCSSFSVGLAESCLCGLVIDKELESSLGLRLKGDNGAVTVDKARHGASAAAGLQRRDVLLAVDGLAVSCHDEAMRRIKHSAGLRVVLLVDPSLRKYKAPSLPAADATDSASGSS